ncbi:hypothetical protein HT031_006103 [Scenedesmus sp. PABB004]|nr:hypothetical protein HT031_006103 [Scenedesmus sp. PABB004]
MAATAGSLAAELGLGTERSDAGGLRSSGGALADKLGGGRSAAGSPPPAPVAPPGALLLVTTVDIGDGASDRIEVREGDVPLEVAAAFVAKHGLPEAITPRLAVHLEDNLAKVAAQKAAAALARAAGDAAAAEVEDGEGAVVFHRLYEQAVALRAKLDAKRSALEADEAAALAAQRRGMSWISSEMMRERSSGPFGNYGSMLYAESMESAARRKDKAERARAERAAEEVSGVTFKPEISRLAQHLWSPHDIGSVPAWQRLSKAKMSKAQERLETLRREKEEAEVAECTFKPSLNGRSQRLMTERAATLRSLNVSAHQQLYQDAVRRQAKQADYAHWYPEEVTFAPKLHESAMSRAFLRRSLGPEGAAALSARGEERHKALVDRLYASYDKLQNKLAEARSTLQTAVDPATGRRLFTPETGRAPHFARNASALPVGEYLYSLSATHADKLAAAAEDKARRAEADAARVKHNSSSAALVRALQTKRFRQIFDFLDQEGLGCVDLVDVIGSGPAWLDDLDEQARHAARAGQPEGAPAARGAAPASAAAARRSRAPARAPRRQVRADLELAAKLLARRRLKHNDSGASEASISMPPPPALGDVAGARPRAARGRGAAPRRGAGPRGARARASHPAPRARVPARPAGCGAPRAGSAPSTPGGRAGVSFGSFCSLMAEVLAARRGPRAYLAPSPPRTFVPAETFQPTITQRSKQLAAKIRPKDTPLFEALYAEGGAIRAKLSEKRAAAEAQATSSCTFAPRLVSHQMVKEGRVMRSVRDGTWNTNSAATSKGGALDSADSLQALAALMAGGAEQRPAAQQPAAAAAAAAERPAEAQRLAAKELSAQLARLQEAQDAAEAAAAAEEAAGAEERRAAAGEAGCDAEAGEAGEAGEEDDFEGSEEQRAYLELEAEVAQMLAATSAAAEAAERLHSASDQQYLSQILGLAQEQVDAMAPAISQLQGLQVGGHSRTESFASEASPSAAASATGAAAGPGGARRACSSSPPKSSATAGAAAGGARAVQASAGKAPLDLFQLAAGAPRPAAGAQRAAAGAPGAAAPAEQPEMHSRARRWCLVGFWPDVRVDPSVWGLGHAATVMQFTVRGATLRLLQLRCAREVTPAGGWTPGVGCVPGLWRAGYGQACPASAIARREAGQKRSWAERQRAETPDPEPGLPAWQKVSPPRRHVMERVGPAAAAAAAARREEHEQRREQQLEQRRTLVQEPAANDLVDPLTGATAPPRAGERAEPPAWAACYARAQQARMPRALRHFGWSLLHGGVRVSGDRVFSYQRAAPELAELACPHPLCRAQQQPPLETLGHVLGGCPVAAAVLQWFAHLWARLQPGFPRAPPPPRVMLADDFARSGVAPELQQLWTHLRLLLLRALLAARARHGGGQPGHAPAAAIRIFVYSVRDAVVLDWRKAAMDVRALAGVPRSWLSGSGKELTRAGFERRWCHRGVIARTGQHGGRFTMEFRLTAAGVPALPAAPALAPPAAQDPVAAAAAAAAAQRGG